MIKCITAILTLTAPYLAHASAEEDIFALMNRTLFQETKKEIAFKQLNSYLDEQLAIFLKSSDNQNEIEAAINHNQYIRENFDKTKALYDTFLESLTIRVENRHLEIEKISRGESSTLLLSYPDLLSLYSSPLVKQSRIALHTYLHNVLLKALSLSAPLTSTEIPFLADPKYASYDYDTFIDMYREKLFENQPDILEKSTPISQAAKDVIAADAQRARLVDLQLFQLYISELNALKKMPHTKDNIEKTKLIYLSILKSSGDINQIYKYLLSFLTDRVKVRHQSYQFLIRSNALTTAYTYPDIISDFPEDYLRSMDLGLFIFQINLTIKALQLYAPLRPDFIVPACLLDPSKTSIDMDTFIDTYASELFINTPETLEKVVVLTQKNKKDILRLLPKKKKSVTQKKPAALTPAQINAEQQRRLKAAAADEQHKKRLSKEQKKLEETRKIAAKSFCPPVSPTRSHSDPTLSISAMPISGRSFVSTHQIPSAKPKTRGEADPTRIEIESDIPAVPTPAQPTTVILQGNHFETYEKVLKGTPGLDYSDIVIMFARLGATVNEATKSSHVKLKYHDANGVLIKRTIVKPHRGDEIGFGRIKGYEEQLSELLRLKNIRVLFKRSSE